ncbi:ribosome biogenesis GTPase Der [Erysipelothrix rhusiopathiae]|uniref:ribosome biogenesis GTPase Der n=1 Tax=Erysipelothrix rhusiopathiae TaxID=1648 RepID=UPI000F42FEA4|nr:ribosome biogenesis GTPase Der [Erysipelothrix rhusiopathiae]AYV34539.1 ribosome biogenesis GTPase Der [Erysipelothrix rhusiopathiae]MDE8081144.1 ribosome biogenesis GTPase Der [Erysipelothrix rhusiopathiae]MDE8314436.1 ribosome biogenesis GTPase Der [Erysipelothrix rhusiopathiae]MDE8329356.1 ribosome biogenesis GTPase Der [Erysipelothrix rhusiopathiae]MDE8333177.1 ribosome biogenesis GTPase Der [Erysipelothrix rhusiopathiae]
MIDGVVAIVGRPNVGKSSLFNRIMGERISIVHDEAGVTRDRLYGKTTWLTKDLRFIDTGGIQMEGQPFQEEIKMQVDIAIDEADIILFVVSAKEGMTTDDEFIARLLRQTNKPVIIAANKVDDVQFVSDIYEFYALGYDEPFAVSCEHGIGLGDLLDEVIKKLPQDGITMYEDELSFCVIGRPNVGKSSLVNAMLNQDRVIVSNIEGTTRDAIDTPFRMNERDYVIIDTAGIRKRGKVYEDVEKYSVLRAMSAIDRSDVVLFLIDGEAGIRAQDKHVVGFAHEAGKPIIIVYNKWDVVDKEETAMEDVKKVIRSEFMYLSYAPIVFVSALTRKRVHTLIPLIEDVHANSIKRISTSVINEVIHDAVMLTPPPSHNGKRLKVFYASQVSTVPPTFVIFVNDPELCHFSYKRYLENALRNAFDFTGTPIRILIRKRGA